MEFTAEQGFLLGVASIFLIGVLGELIFKRTQIPDVIWLMIMGVFMGPVTGLVPRSFLEEVAPFFGAVTLVVVLFDGGIKLNITHLIKAAPRSGLIASVGFVGAVTVTALLTMIAHKVGILAEWGWIQALITGAIVGGASSVVIMPAIDQSDVDPDLANTVKLESALTDVFCVVGAMTLVGLQGSNAIDRGEVITTLVASFGMGLGIGVIGGVMWLVLGRLWDTTRHRYPMTLASLMVLYVITERMGGSAALGVLAAAVTLGNAPMLAKRLRLPEGAGLDWEVERFHEVVAFMVKSFFFAFIGLMLYPPWSLIGLGVLLAVGLILIRIPVIKLACRGEQWSAGRRALMTVSMPRGMAAGVLALVPWQVAQIPGTKELPIVIFACVFATIVFFAAGFPWAMQRIETENQDSKITAPAHPATNSEAFDSNAKLTNPSSNAAADQPVILHAEEHSRPSGSDSDLTDGQS
ncbi:MAG: cation:proton antiporter [Myxococcota bacterium]|nr:cation:proton antiporter [Myxococcota bacterium]